MIAEEYRRAADLEANNWWQQGMIRIYRALLARRLPSARDRRILDIGCGVGHVTRHVARFGGVVAADRSKLALSLFDGGDRIPKISCDVRRLPFRRDSFDAVTAFGIIEHVPDDHGALREIRRVLRAGGRCVLLTSAYAFLWSEHDEANEHCRRYTRRSLEGVVRGAGLKLRDFTFVNAILFPPIALIRLLQTAARRFGARFPVQRDHLRPIPRGLDRLLRSILGIEEIVLRRDRWPFGVSMIAVVEKTGCHGSGIS